METTTRQDEQGSERSRLMSELADVAHGLRTAANALTEEHAVMARYATRAADLVEGTGQRLERSPRLSASLDHLRQLRPKALRPTAALLGFVGTRILSSLGATAAPKAEEPAPSADALVSSETQRDQWQPSFQPWAPSAETGEESPSIEPDLAPMREDERSSESSDEYASRLD